VSAVNGSVVTLPLVGCVPLQPPDAVHVSAYFALHCKVAEVPMGTVLFVAASVTTGFETPLLPGGAYPLTSLDEDCPHAVRTEIAAQTIAQRTSLVFTKNCAVQKFIGSFPF
jgi:hypothetical protein